MDISSLTTIDYMTFVITGISMIFGVYHGFIKSTLGFIGWIISAIITLAYFEDVTNFLDPYIKHKILLNIIASIGVYVFLLIVISVINSRLFEMMIFIIGGTIDRSLGLAFGIIRGLLICSIMFLATEFVVNSVDNDEKNEKKDNPKWLKEAKTYNLLKFCADYLSSQDFSGETLEKIIDILNLEPKVKPLLEHKNKIDEIKENIEDKIDNVNDKITIENNNE